MAGLNRAMIIGHLGRDPEMKYSQAGLAIANFSVATTEKFKEETKTEWHKIVAFGKLAEICGQYLTKGKQIYVEGRIQYRDYEGKDGSKKYVTEIIANTMQMLGSKGDGQGQAQERPVPEAFTEPMMPPVDDLSDIPF